MYLYNDSLWGRVGASFFMLRFELGPVCLGNADVPTESVDLEMAFFDPPAYGLLRHVEIGCVAFYRVEAFVFMIWHYDAPRSRKTYRSQRPCPFPKGTHPAVNPAGIALRPGVP